MAEKLYKLTEGDKAIFEKARKARDPSIITNYYLRSLDSGTYWRVVTEADVDVLVMPESKEAALKWKRGYTSLYAIWEKLGKPDFFGPDHKNLPQWRTYNEQEYQALYDELLVVYRVLYDYEQPDPVFHHPHGKIFLPWTTKMHLGRTPIQSIIGGFGSAKTFGKAMSFLVRGITLPGYRAFAIAPQSKQSEEVHKIIVDMVTGTLFEKFILNTPLRPNPTVALGNDMVGRNTIECYPGDDPGKFLTLTADEALIDQAERMDGNGTTDIDTIIRSMGTRFRGMVRGRPRLGQMTFLANSGDNPALWDLYDQGLKEPNYIWSYSPSTFENIYLTLADLVRYEKQAGTNVYELEMGMKGARPIGAGEHFSKATLQASRSEILDSTMADALEQGVDGFVRVEVEKAGVVKWEMPYRAGRDYLTVADAGWANPPNRNSPVVAVFDITDFPVAPCTMQAFTWVYGNNSPNPFIDQYTNYVFKYHCVGSNGYDATGPGAGYERLDGFSTLVPTPVQMGGQRKYTMLTLIKKFMADGLIQVPNIPHLFSQCSKYKLPDEKIRQDIVMMLLVLAGMLEERWYDSHKVAEEDDERKMPMLDRYWRPAVDRVIVNNQLQRTGR